MHILFTRPELDSVYLAKKFIQLGHQVSIFPVLNIVKKNIININFSTYHSVVFTSSNAVLCLDQEGSSSIRCYCVGSATAEQARKKGFTDIVTAGGDYQQLKEIILNLSNKTDGKFLYLRGEYISNDLEKDLTDEGYQVDSFVNYTTFPNPDFDQQTLQIFKDQNIDLIFIYSKRSAEHLLKLIFNNQLESKCNLIQLRCISENVFHPLQKVKWKNIKIFSPGNEEFSLD